MIRIHVVSDLIFNLDKETSLSSYRNILTALDEAQVALQIVADKTQHFLHETLREIATRIREHHTMTTNITMTQIVEGHTATDTVATPSVTPNHSDFQNEISPEMLAEIANTAVTKASQENQKTFKPRPAFMQTEAEDFKNEKVFNPKPRSF